MNMDYTSVTPTLHVGTSLPFEHVECRTSGDAAALIKDGETVLVPSMNVAMRVLRLLGLPEHEISERITFATDGRVREAV